LSISNACLLQISRAILNEQQKIKTNWFEEPKPVNKEELEEKIDQLHAAITDMAQSFGPDMSTDSKDKSNNSIEALDTTGKVI
jgi:tetrahydromethanopterin S-methyltransferase subunit B